MISMKRSSQTRIVEELRLKFCNSVKSPGRLSGWAHFSGWLVSTAINHRPFDISTISSKRPRREGQSSGNPSVGWHSSVWLSLWQRDGALCPRRAPPQRAPFIAAAIFAVVRRRPPILAAAPEHCPNRCSCCNVPPPRCQPSLPPPSLPLLPPSTPPLPPWLPQPLPLLHRLAVVVSKCVISSTIAAQIAAAACSPAAFFSTATFRAHRVSQLLQTCVSVSIDIARAAHA